MILALVTDMVAQGAARLAAGQMDRALTGAVLRYSADRPRRRRAEAVSLGGYVLPLPAGWEADVSEMQWIETSAGRLDAEQWRLHEGVAGAEIRLVAPLPAGQAVLLCFTAAHSLTDAECTIPALHHDAVACYAAASLCEQIATACADNADPTIAVDRIDQTSPAREWALRAKSYRGRYFAALGIASSGGQESARVPPAGAVADLDLMPSFGKTFLFSRGRR